MACVLVLVCVCMVLYIVFISLLIEVHYTLNLFIFQFVFYRRSTCFIALRLKGLRSNFAVGFLGRVWPITFNEWKVIPTVIYEGFVFI